MGNIYMLPNLIIYVKPYLFNPFYVFPGFGIHPDQFAFIHK